jgi:Tfp pilus assembly protein PilF
MVALAGLMLVTDGVGPASARRLLAALLAVSLFQSLPWTVLNLSVPRTQARIAALPLGRGRSHMMLGTYDLNAGELAGAEAQFRSALAEDSLNVNALSGLGLVLARSGRLAEAESPLARAAELKPAVAQYRRDLALLYLHRAEWTAAGAQLQTALALEPGDVASWLSLAECERQLGHPDSAVFALRAARDHVSDNAELRGALADSYAMWVASAGRRGDVAEFARAWDGFTRECADDPRVAEWQGRARAMLERAPTAR